MISLSRRRMFTAAATSTLLLAVAVPIASAVTKPVSGLAYSSGAIATPTPLSHATISGAVVISVPASSAPASFFLDDPNGGGQPAATGATYPLDTTSLAAGPHSILAILTETSGKAHDVFARFMVGAATVTPPATATPTATPAATTTPTGSGDWAVAFGTRPASQPVTCNGQSNVTISGKTFSGVGNDVSSIDITNCHHVLITANDFKDDAQPITVHDSTDIEISWNRYENITGPHERNGSNRANFSQWDGVIGGSIHDNKGIGGDTEDIVSVYNSGGTDAAHPLIIENNAFEGTNWSSDSGSGLMLGDTGGSHIVARNNTLINPGQVGIGVPGGSDIHVLNNTVYGAVMPLSNTGIYVWNQSSGACSDIEVSGNKVSWKNAAGADNASWDGGGCGTVAGWDSNNWNATIDPTTIHVTL